MTLSLPRYLLALPILLAAVAAVADNHEELERPSFFASQSATVNAVVRTVDYDTREVVLERSDGEIIEFTATSEVRNLDQVEPGDVVTAEYVESISIEVFANEGYEPEDVALAALARAEAGQKPGVAAIDTLVSTATVEDINIEANTFKLRNASGEIREYRARNPENLKRAKVGDLVVTTVTNAMAISVAEQPSE